MKRFLVLLCMIVLMGGCNNAFNDNSEEKTGGGCGGTCFPDPGADGYLSLTKTLFCSDDGRYNYTITSRAHSVPVNGTTIFKWGDDTSDSVDGIDATKGHSYHQCAADNGGSGGDGIGWPLAVGYTYSYLSANGPTTRTIWADMDLVPCSKCSS